MPAATMTTMTNTAPIAVTQPKTDPAKIGMINNNRQGKHILKFFRQPKSFRVDNLSTYAK